MACYPRRLKTIAFLSLGIINVIVYVLVFVASITKAIDGKLGEIIQAVYCCSFSIFLVFNELKTFNLSDIYFGFLNVYQGKGLLMLLLGCLVMSENAFNIIVTIFGFTIGLGYVILSFIPCISLPKDICYCLHQYRNQKDDGYDHQHNTLVKYGTQPQEKANSITTSGFSCVRELSLDNNAALFTSQSPIHPSSRSIMNGFHY